MGLVNKLGGFMITKRKVLILIVGTILSIISIGSYSVYSLDEMDLCVIKTRVSLGQRSWQKGFYKNENAYRKLCTMDKNFGRDIRDILNHK